MFSNYIVIFKIFTWNNIFKLLEFNHILIVFNVLKFYSSVVINKNDRGCGFKC